MFLKKTLSTIQHSGFNIVNDKASRSLSPTQSGYGIPTVSDVFKNKPTASNVDFITSIEENKPLLHSDSLDDLLYNTSKTDVMILNGNLSTISEEF